MASHKVVSLLFVGLLCASNLYLSEAQVGVCYGRMGNNLPAPKDVISLFKSNKITRVRLLEPDYEILDAFKGTDIEVVLGLQNAELIPFSNNPYLAGIWVAVYVKPYVDDVKIKYIVVGNEMSRNDQHFSEIMATCTVMKQMQEALRKQGFRDIKVTTSVDPSILVSLGPNQLPSTTNLTDETHQFFDELLPFLSNNGAPLLFNMYPYYELIKYPNEVKPDFALFTATGNVVTHGKLGYQNKFDLMLDSFYTTLELKGYPNIEIHVSETGWPSEGGEAATLENEKTYVTNLIQHLCKGTPKRPNKPIHVYFNLFDEADKGHPLMEKHFGLFTADGKIKFSVVFSTSAWT